MERMEVGKVKRRDIRCRGPNVGTSGKEIRGNRKREG